MAKKDPNVYIKQTLIDDHEVSEIDFDLHKKFKFDYEDDGDFITIEDGQGSSDGYPIEIDKMIKILQQFKNKGATHVAMNYHCDHIGYEMSAYEIKKATQDDIDKHYGQYYEK